MITVVVVVALILLFIAARLRQVSSNSKSINDVIPQFENEMNKIKKKYFSYDSYLILDNGGSPFKVYIKDKKVDIYKASSEVYETLQEEDVKIDINYVHNEQIAQLKALKIFIGKSPETPMTRFSLGYGPQFDGNTILLKQDKNKYIFVGSYIFAFKSPIEIIEFVSQVGNSGVPYPYASDKKGNYIIFEHNLCFHVRLDKAYDDVIGHYYDQNKKLMKKGLITPLKVKIIHERI